MAGGRDRRQRSGVGSADRGTYSLPLRLPQPLVRRGRAAAVSVVSTLTRTSLSITMRMIWCVRAPATQFAACPAEGPLVGQRAEAVKGCAPWPWFDGSEEQRGRKWGRSSQRARERLTMMHLRSYAGSSIETDLFPPAATADVLIYTVCKNNN